MAGEMPDIKIAHVETPLTNTELGANGISESGTIGAIAALWCAVNDALRPLGARVAKQPFTPEHVLEVIAARVVGSSGQARRDRFFGVS